MQTQFIQVNFPKFIFTIPWIDRPVTWYGVCFAFGFLLSYWVAYKVFLFYLKKFGTYGRHLFKDYPEFLNELHSQKQVPVPVKLSKKSSQVQGKNINQIQDQWIDWLFSVPWHPDKGNRSAMIEKISQTFKTSVKSLSELAQELTDQALLPIIIGTTIGARLFHVFFYGWPYYRDHLWEIPMVWEGGLASHGGVLGALAGWGYFYFRFKKQYPFMNPMWLLDMAAISIGPALGMIRIGNFINQEILGTPSTLPWAIVFLNPAGGLPVVPRHPVQIYESLSYFLVSAILIYWWKRLREYPYPQGIFFCLGNILFFSARLVLEFFKEKQSEVINETPGLFMGQLLSVPFILLGLGLGFILLKKSFRDEEKYPSK